MNKEKAELYAKLYARAFLITETAENNLREDRHYYGNSENKWEELFCFASELLDKVQEQAEKDLTKEELDIIIKKQKALIGMIMNNFYIIIY